MSWLIAAVDLLMLALLAAELSTRKELVGIQLTLQMLYQACCRVLCQVHRARIKKEIAIKQ